MMPGKTKTLCAEKRGRSEVSKPFRRRKMMPGKSKKLYVQKKDACPELRGLTTAMRSGQAFFLQMENLAILISKYNLNINGQKLSSAKDNVLYLS